MNYKINIYDLSENRINQAIENLTKFHKDKIQTFSDSLDVNLEIALQLIEKQKAEIEEKDKEIKCLKCLHNTQVEIIDLMVEQLAGLTIFDIDKEEPLILKDKEEVKQYFEKKVEEDK